jgi:PIN domain nuclease of toxin-antitoxin system
MSESPLLLDTHVWLWFVDAAREIKPELRKLIRTTLKNDAVLIPSICVWEIGMLWRKNRIQVSKPIEEWVQEALDKTGFTLIPMSQAIALEAATLPGSFHNDPADCMIVATARIEGATLVTRDTRILAYADAGHVNVVVA